jgi:hypothetical protein
VTYIVTACNEITDMSTAARVNPLKPNGIGIWEPSQHLLED